MRRRDRYPALAAGVALAALGVVGLVVGLLASVETVTELSAAAIFVGLGMGLAGWVFQRASART